MRRKDKKETKRLLAADLFRYGELTGIKGFIKGLYTPGFRYTFFFRKASEAKEHSIKWFLFGYIKRKLSFKFGFQIPVYTDIGEGLYIEHFGNLIITEEAKIGKNCNIAHNVTIERVLEGEYKGSPSIGDRVYISSGVIIMGKIQIGSDVFIAPNTLVTVDVPNNSFVSGNPCIIVNKVNPCKGYINNILE